MKKKIWAFALATVALFTFNACSDDDDPDVTPEYLEGAVGYVAGAGNWNQNNGTVGAIMQNTTGTYGFSDIYTYANNRGIGDAQDVLPFGNDLYVTCTTSSKVEVLKADGSVEKSYPMNGNQQPRYLATDGSYVYFSAYSGYVYKMTKEQGVIDSVQVGSHPEAMSVANGKLYVNMSDYNYDNSGASISVVDLSSFHKTKEISCELNPYNQSLAVGNKVYFVSNYHSEKTGKVQCIDATTDVISQVCDASAIAYNQTTNSLVCLKSYYVTQYEPVYSSTFVFAGLSAFNLSTNQETTISAPDLKSPSQVNVDPATGNIYVIDNPSYSTPSVLYIYDRNGNLLQGNIAMCYSVQNIRFPYESYN